MKDNKLLYVALGDSLTSGVGGVVTQGFVKRYAQALEKETHRQVKCLIYAKNGATTQKVLSILSRSYVKEAIKQADVVTISAGGNDLIRAARWYYFTKSQKIFPKRIQRCIENFSLILSNIIKLKSTCTKPYIIRIVGLYNPFPALVFGDTWVKTFNKQLERFEIRNVKVAKVYEGFQQGGKNVLSIDGLHPNSKGYKIISNALINLGFGPLDINN